jgi:hypothetical protein
MESSKDKLRLIAALLKASAESDTEEFENEKRSYDSMHISQGDPAYINLLHEIQDAIDCGRLPPMDL